MIKVEPPKVGDPMRQWGREKVDGSYLWWPVVGRNKRSVTLNLREAEGQAMFLELVKDADIVVENFRPGTMEKWGLSYEKLKEVNPGIIMVRVSGYGQTGPYSSRAGYGSIGEAMGGIRYTTGDPDRQPRAPASRSVTRSPRCTPPSERSLPCTTATSPARARSSTARSTKPCSR